MKNIKIIILFILVPLILSIFSCNNPTYDNPVDVDYYLEHPSELSIIQTSIKSIELNWVDNCEVENGYIIHRKRNLEEWEINYAIIPENSVKFSDTNLVANSIYHYKVKAYNDENSSTEVITSISLEFPPPTELIITQETLHSVLIEWKDNSIGEQGFIIDRKEGANPWEDNLIVLSENTNSVSDQNLSATNDYQYRIRAFNDSINTSYETASIDMLFPAPSNLNLTVSNLNTIQLTWQDNSLGEEYFSIDRKQDNQEWNIAYARVQENITSFIDSNLNPNSTYTYRVQALSNDDVSDSIQETIDLSFPAPSNFLITPNSLTSIMLTWTDNSNNEDGFKIDRRVNNGNWEIAYANLGPDTEIYLDNNLIANKQYSYRLYAYLGTETTTNQYAEYYAHFSAPSNLVIVQNSLNSCQLMWEDNNLQEENYVIDRKTGNGDWQTNYAVLEANSESFTDTDLDFTINYYYRVYAQLNNISSDFDTGFISLENPVPTNFSAIQTALNQITLTWSDNTNFNTGYVIDRKINSEDYDNNYIVLGGEAVSFVDSLITPNNQYTYRLYCLDSDYQSQTTLVSCTSKISAPSNLSLAQIAIDKCRLTWQDNTGGNAEIRIDRRRNNNPWEDNYVTLLPNTTAFIDSSLIYDNYYYYRIYSIYDGVSSNSIESSIQILNEPVEFFSVSQLQRMNCALLEWYNNPVIGDSLKIERKIEEEDWLPLATLPINTPSYIDTTYFSTKLHNYRIKIQHGDIYSPYAETSLISNLVYIDRSEDFLRISEFMNSWYYADIELISDIDVAGAEGYHIMGSSFGGNFNGNGYTLSNLVGGPIIGTFSGDTFSNLNVKNTIMPESGSFNGFIVGYASGSSVIDNCHVLSDSEIEYTNSTSLFGGIVVGTLYYGTETVTISNCSTSANITMTFNTSYNNSEMGGIMGHIDSSIDLEILNCTNNMNINLLNTATNNKAAGILGKNAYNGGSEEHELLISNCVNNGNILNGNGISDALNYQQNILDCINNGNITNGNGILNYINSEGTISNCVNNGNITNGNGILNHINSGGTISNCVNNGHITNGNGIANSTNSWSTISNCVNNGNITDGNGILLSNSYDGYIINCRNNGDIIDGNGIVYTNSGTITNSANHGNISEGSGICNINYGGTISYSFNTGNFTYGGIAKENYGYYPGSHYQVASILDCYNSGYSNGGSGIVNERGSLSQIFRSYNLGDVGEAGYAIGTSYSIYNCYWDSQTSGTVNGSYDVPNTNQAVGLTTLEMQNSENYVGWDFVEVWVIDPNVNDGYPYLINNPPLPLGD